MISVYCDFDGLTVYTIWVYIVIVGVVVGLPLVPGSMIE